MLKTLRFLFIIIFTTFTINAQSDPFIGQISMFGGNFAPRGWAFCNGQLLAISQNTALFSLLGTIYGGNGVTTFALPDLRGRTPIHAGNGPGLSTRVLGTKIGTEVNVLNLTQMPSHNHIATNIVTIELNTSTENGEESSPENQYLAAGNNIYVDTPTANTKLAGISGTVTTTIANSGGNQPINNMQPSITIHYIIALQGIYPSRN